MSSDPRHISASDAELIILYKQSGDLGTIGVLYDRYMSMVYGVCLKYLKNRDESKDAVMQLFEKLVESLKQHEVANFKSWLYVMAKNHCLMAIRARKGKNFEEISPFLMESDTLLHQDDEPEMEANLSKLENCIEQLVIEQKHCVQLFYLEQKCYREIAELTGYDDNKVKSYIQNGKRNLKICMEKNG